MGVNEVKLALEKGYNNTKIHADVKYKRYNGLMHEYVGNFMKMTIENSGVDTQDHKRLGFNFEIKPEETIKQSWSTTSSQPMFEEPLGNIWAKMWYG
jgi:hypothetical protein